MAIVYFLNVGQGDCSIIEHNSERLTMIDINMCENVDINSASSVSRLNESNPRGNFNQKEHPTDPIEFLKNNYPNENLFRFILTHPDMDHLKGIKYLNDEISFTNFWSYENSKNDSNIMDGDKDDWNFYQELLYKNYFKALDGVNISYLKEDSLKILSPTSTLIEKANKNKDWNDCSVVILFECDGFKFLFCGDCHDNTMNHLLKQHKSEISNIDVLFAPHHGRDSNRNFDFLDVMKPHISILGNADNSRYLAYYQYSKKSDLSSTNNQAGNFKFEISNKCLKSYVSNYNFAKEFCDKNNLPFNDSCDDEWYCIDKKTNKTFL